MGCKQWSTLCWECGIVTRLNPKIPRTPEIPELQKVRKSTPRSSERKCTAFSDAGTTVCQGWSCRSSPSPRGGEGWGGCSTHSRPTGNESPMRILGRKGTRRRISGSMPPAKVKLNKRAMATHHPAKRPRTISCAPCRFRR